MNAFEFPPMDKSDRYIVNDIVATEYPELLSEGVGELEERYGLVYRKVRCPSFE